MSLPIAFIIGTSSGIGLKTALLLASNGYYIFAGMRNNGTTLQRQIRAQMLGK